MQGSLATYVHKGSFLAPGTKCLTLPAVPRRPYFLPCAVTACILGLQP